MAETADYDPGPWGGYDFKKARATYDAHVGRSYGDAVSKKIDKTDLVPESVSTNINSPLVIACDVTGSMGAWPATIFSKLPYLDIEGKEYLGPDMEISFAAIGDHVYDSYPLQVQPFVGGLKLEDTLQKLVIEGGGGGNQEESYQLAALYYARNCNMPSAIKPIFIFIGDEGFYEDIYSDNANLAKVVLNESVKGLNAIQELQNKFEVYIIRKPYGNYQGSEREERIRKQWEDALGVDHVCMLQDPGRVVDVIFGILAKETGKIKYFNKEIKDRQKPEQVDVVMKSLVSVHKLPKPSQKLLKKPQASVTRKKNNDEDGPSSISLLED